MTTRRWPALLLAFGVNACSVDDRTLELAEGAGAVGGANASGGSGSGNSAVGGGGTDSSGLVDGCADLDTDGVADCEDTLVGNPTFAADVSDWVHLDDAVLEWDPKNALEDLPSGSAKLSDDTKAGTLRVRAHQCVPLEGDWLVIAYASALVETTDDTEDLPQAVLEVSFFQGDDCEGQFDGSFETPQGPVADAWTTVHAGGRSKDTTSSASIALVGSKPTFDSELTVYFDNVMLKAKEP